MKHKQAGTLVSTVIVCAALHIGLTRRQAGHMPGSILDEAV